MRSEQALKNMIANIVLQIIVFTSGLLLPRFFLEAYGSSVNGMVSSVTQFLGYLGLAEAGVGTASIVALYKPLADEDQNEVNCVLTATKDFYNRSGVIFTALVVCLAMVYPYFVSQQLDSTLIRAMILILASSTIVDYVLLGKYKVFLTANQKGYVVFLIQGIGTAVNMVLSIVLIYSGQGVLLVKAIVTFVYIMRFFLVRGYVRKVYPEVNFKATPHTEKLHQRGAALLHQVVGTIVNNTDVVVLTICLGAKSLLEVSVYSIYSLVSYAVSQLLLSFSDSLTAGFGEVISKGEEKTLQRSFKSYEYMFMIILFIAVGCVWTLLVPFVSVYTINVSDVNYFRPDTGILFALLVFLQNVRVPGITIICAAGHYKETQRQAITEAVINIVISLTLVWRFGMNGVLFGTVCSYGYRSFEIIYYNSKYLVHNSGKTTCKRIIRNMCLSAVLILGGLHFVPQTMHGFVQWFCYAAIYGMISVGAVTIWNYIWEPQEFQILLRRLTGIFHRE